MVPTCFINYRDPKAKRRFVRVKSLNDIKRTLDKDGRCKEVFFTKNMEEYCGTIQEIAITYGGCVNFVDNDFCWIPDWFEDKDCIPV